MELLLCGLLSGGMLAAGIWWWVSRSKKKRANQKVNSVLEVRDYSAEMGCYRLLLEAMKEGKVE